MGWNLATANTNVTGTAILDDQRTVWQTYDPGLATTSPQNHQYYSKVVSAAEHQAMMTLGWKMSAIVEIPEDEPTTGIAWGNDRHQWVAYIHQNPGNTSRTLYGLMFGRDVNGNATLQIYGASGTKVVGKGYHEYSMIYDPSTGNTGVYIDGEFWKNVTGGNLAGSGSQMIYWGDNNNQPSAVEPRITNYDHIELGIVPEPRSLWLCGSGIFGMLLATRRRPSH